MIIVVETKGGNTLPVHYSCTYTHFIQVSIKTIMEHA